MKKLYKHININQKLPFAVKPDHSIILSDAGNIPTLRWPSGSWCIEANIWLLELYDRGLSRSDRGGSLLSYATNISHLIRYCDAQNTRFLDLTDLQFNFFVTTLLGQRRADGTKLRTQNTVKNIAKNCVDFIDFLSREFHSPSRLTITAIEQTIFTPDGSKLIRNSKSHSAIPPMTRVEERFPINIETIKCLRLAAAADASASPYVKSRRRVMIRCFEMLGARRAEVGQLRVRDVRAAVQTQHLRVVTLKGGVRRSINPAADDSGRFREIPISQADLKLLTDYIEYVRAPLARRLKTTHDYLFLNERTGNPLTPNAFTAEIQHIAKLGKILDPVSPHLFRHRFITKIFVAEILRQKADSLEDFKQAILETESLKRKIQELTGHRRLASLERYIHLAWEEAMAISKTSPKFKTLTEIDAIREQATALLANLTEQRPSKETKALLDLLLSFEALL
ncbi:site-specific integrase [Pseudomonas sp. JQ170]|uniref:tyrosine-type recombinase/integrase n=1 Tax=unclassified Pseudomonas TaxID=196821 RepID=UPI0026549B5D|nr:MULTISPECIES: tyrosine-type recombinase/integrase [unclassified Pseudomonas]MDN7142148.1 site-specific integrase [Pseudomonas sp. JQ170]WRO76943.1 tyrosine-type recombinase/integrase [Pseudomonas sp. 170C]